MPTILNDEWVYLRPGDMLRMWNERGGIEIAFVVAVVAAKGEPVYRDALLLSRSLGIRWINERDLLDNRRYETTDP